jgi:hypothetical protein
MMLATAAPEIVPTKPSCEPSAAAVAAAREPPMVWASERPELDERSGSVAEGRSEETCGRFSVRVFISAFL